MAERPRAERAAGVLNRPQAAWENRASCLEEVAGEKAQWLNVTPAGRHREEPPPAEAQERETPGHQEMPLSPAPHRCSHWPAPAWNSNRRRVLLARALLSPAFYFKIQIPLLRIMDDPHQVTP